jgi:glycosyltransferase involved in cell wall biosynthesis
MGIGAALRSGYFNSRFENICVIPADGQFDLDELIPYPHLAPKTYISFFRQKQQGYSPFRFFLSRVNRAVNRCFLGIQLQDVNWVKVYKREELLALDLRLKSSLIESEICAKLGVRGNRCVEIPSIYHDRIGGQAKGASLKIVLKALVETCLLIWTVWTFQIRKNPQREPFPRP